MEIKHGDILVADEQFICHQCNCISNSAGGLAFFLFKKFPWADIYSTRKHHHKPAPDDFGNIVVKGDKDKNERLVVNMLAQYAPGSARGRDSEVARLAAFKNGLDKITALPDLKSVAFPFCIGCGLAGGDWSKYKAMLEAFEIEVAKVGANVSLYVRPEDKNLFDKSI